MVEIIGVELVKWVEVIIAVIATVVVGYVASWTFGKILRRTTLQDESQRKLKLVLRYLTYAIGSILIIVFLAFDIIGAIIGLGVLGIGISIALGGFLSSVLSGMMVILDRDFKVGDEIRVASFQGKIVKVSLRKTILETANGEKVSVPNAFILANPVAKLKAEKLATDPT